MTLGEKICRLRKARGLSQGDLADALGVSRQSVSKWETDSSVPDLDKLVALSRRFGVTLDELVCGEGDAEKEREPEPLPAAQPQGRQVLGGVLLTVGLSMLEFTVGGVHVGFSLLLVCSVAAFSRINSLGSGGMTLEQNGQVVEQTITENGVTTVYDGEGNIIDQYEDPNYQPPEPITPAAVGTVVVLFLVSNIPTVVFGGIWLHYKNRRDFQEDLKKMKIEDLG